MDKNALDAYLLLGAALFCIGIYGVLTRRNAVAILMAIELMLNAANINLIAFARYSDPVYIVDGVVHYGVANMPGAVPRTSTLALSNSTLPYILRLARMGSVEAMAEDPGLAKGLNTYGGDVTYQAVAEYFGLPFVEYVA